MYIIDEVYKKVLSYLAERGNKETSIYDISRDLGVGIKLLLSNPKVKRLLEMNKCNIKSLLNMTIRDWLEYHFQYIHQGYKYDYPELQQTWMGKITVKNPLDCWIQQEIIFRTKPDIVIELGVAFGGTSLFYAHMLDLIKKDSKVIGIDVNLDRVQNVNHPKIEFIKGSSTDKNLIEKLYERFKDKNVMVVADSNHEKNHVLQELRLYSKFIKQGFYFVVEDGIFSFLNLFPVPMDGPYEAIEEFLLENDSFAIDKKFAERYIITHCPNGYLRRVK